MKYVIVGAGVAGIGAAREIRKRDTEGKITIIDENKEGHIYRPALKEYVVNRIDEEGVYGIQKNILKTEKINILTARAESINVEKKVVIYSQNGKKSVIKYDKLLLSTGANPLFPPYLNDREKYSNVFAFRSFKDAELIKTHLEKNNGICAVIGGGVLGMEIAELLINAGWKALLISRSKNLVFHGIPEKLKEHVISLFKKNNVEIMTEVDVIEVLSTKNKFTGLITSKGNIKADMAIVCTGVAPNLLLAESAGIEVSKGIHVDKTMKTNIDDIYAAGDCAVMMWSSKKTLRLWEPCHRMGRTAGANMSGGTVEFDPWPIYYHTFLFNIPLGFFGEFDASLKGYDRVFKESKDIGYRELVIKEGILVGGSFLGGRPFPPPFFHMMKTKKAPKGDYKNLLNDDFDFESLWYL